MSGHNKWSKIKHKKAANDAKKGKQFTKLLREIEVSARMSGPDSPRVSLIISKGRSINLPNDLIKRALQRAADKNESNATEEVCYEAYGPGGVAIVMDALTDNRNRTIADVRHIISKGGGTMASEGSVLWQFEIKGQLSFPKEKVSEEALMEHLLEHGVEDIDSSDEEMHYVTCDPAELVTVRDAADAAALGWEDCELARIPKNLVPVDAEAARKVLALMDKLEDYDDIQSVYSNMDIPEDLDLAEV